LRDCRPEVGMDGRLERSPALRAALLLSLFILALGLRLPGINEPYFSTHVTRQYRAAILTRLDYLATLKSVPEWRMDIARLNAAKEGTLEPPIVETVALVCYRLLGHECFWAPRLFAICSWMAGAVLLYLIAHRMAGPVAAVVSTAVFLLQPWGIIFSRSFMPDPLMLTMLLLTLLLMLRHFERPRGSSLTWLCVAAGLAPLVQAKCAPLIVGAFVALALCRHGWRRALTGPSSWIFLAAAVLPMGVYYGGGILGGTALARQADMSFVPRIILRPFFWGGWLLRVQRVTGLVSPVLAATGSFFFVRRESRALMFGLWGGYLALGLVFPVHIHTHDSYQAQFLVIVALGVGPLAAWAMRKLEEHLGGTAWAGIVTTGLVVLAVVLALSSFVLKKREIAEAIAPPSQRGNSAFFPRFNPDLSQLVRNAEEIGRAVEHSTKVILLSPYDSNRYRYHAEIAGVQWPRFAAQRKDAVRGLAARGAEACLESLRAGGRADFFIVTDLREFYAQSDLREILVSRYPTLAETEDWMVFDLRDPRPAPTGRD